MMRTLWVGAVVIGATAFYGGQAIILSLLGRRGMVYAELTRAWAAAILRASGTRVVVHGAEHIPPDRPAVVVSNHVSGYDVFAIAAGIPGAFRFVAKKELERIPFFGAAWKAAGHISVDRSNRQRALASLHAAGAQIRAEGGTVIIFPEGTRSRTGRLQPFKKGAFMLAVEAGAPVVPTVVLGSYNVIRPGSYRVRPSTIHLCFDTPIPTDQLRTGDIEALMERVRARMFALLDTTDLLPPPR